ncbi:sigma-70 family RNA polymerase sigma factor [Microbacterium sp. CFH 31415]|uniref:RNA polymerase sigma factor n=1 Tax=Microbacterium sp. CFH 31415 TaxID=2921732 RepID=UPI001F1333B1|nr:sigma-70 family RNA polymerase sigma factor [Microbacterium sp. CFH 31415]MCH6229799.1 sigma-70 family RNA polymerase sigma factor [Microbacterium sp. CFH 31415]
MTTDADIIRLSLERPAEFAEIFVRHAKPVGAFAARRVGVAAAQDVLSETFLIAFRRRDSFDTAWASARPWLLGIASRVAGKHRRDEAAQWRAFAAESSSRALSSDDAVEAAGERLDAAASTRSLAPLIAGLARRDRDTLLLYAWGDLSYEQIGQALGVPTGTVRSRLNRVRRKLSAGTEAPETAADRNGGGIDGRVGSRA